MALRLLLATFVVLPQIISAANVVCYFTTWSTYRPGHGQFQVANIDPNLCTHVVYSFVGLSSDGTVWTMDDWEATGLHEISNLNALKSINPDLKVLLSIGGYSEGSTIFSAVSADADKRKVLAGDLLHYLDTYGFDGVDVFWQYPSQRGGDPTEDPDNFNTLLSELKDALHDNGYILSAGVAGSYYTVLDAYHIVDLAPNVDMLNVMNIDIHGVWDGRVGHSSPLYESSLDAVNYQQQQNVDYQIQYYIAQGADPSVINLGIYPAGRTYTLADENNTELYADISGPGSPGPFVGEAGLLAYNEVCESIDDYELIWDDEQMVAHLIKGDQWVSFENVDSVEVKAQYAVDQGLGGIAINSIDYDDFGGFCGDKYPILTKINDVLND